MSPRSHRALPSSAAARALARLGIEAGAAIREERQRRRWSLRAVAARAGISPAHLADLERGSPASLESYVRVMIALDRHPSLVAVDPRARSWSGRKDEDFVHAAMAEVQATRLGSFGFRVAIDEPYQHYQFAGRADVVAWDPGARALLHIENRTRFPNVQDTLGSFGAKRAYLGPVLAERFGIRGGWRSETHVIAGLWSSEVLRVVRLREATFRAVCPASTEALEAWWVGDEANLTGVASSLALFDPGSSVRAAYRFAAPSTSTRPRYRDYAGAAEALRRQAFRR